MQLNNNKYFVISTTLHNSCLNACICVYLCFSFSSLITDYNFRLVSLISVTSLILKIHRARVFRLSSVQFSLVAQLYPTLHDPVDCSTSGFPVHHQHPELTRVSDAIQPSQYLSPLLLPPSIFPCIWVFSKSRFFASGGQSTRASASVLPVNIQD